MTSARDAAKTSKHVVTKENERKSETKPAASKKNGLFAVAYAAGLLSVAAFLSPVSQLNLYPVYGQIGSQLYHRRGETFTIFLAYITNNILTRKGIIFNSAKWIAPWAYYIPPLQWLVFQLSAQLGPTYGPIITEGITYFPVLYLSSIPCFHYLGRVKIWGAAIALVYGAFILLNNAAMALVPQLLGQTDFFSRSGLELLAATVSALITRSSLLAFAVPAVLHTLFSNPHYNGPGPLRLLNATLIQQDWLILDRADSTTGYISVLQNTKDDFRVLRCDHSLLGGEWLLNEQRKSMGYEDDETIYGVFTMLENVRIVKQEVFTPDDEKDALFIGLGAGTAPKAFIQHGLNVTIVELDPKVHEYAEKYFNLPEEHNIVIADAESWAESYAKSSPESFDYVVHDVFTGGAEPTSLFTLEFLRDLATLLKEDGVIAINYAGDISEPPVKIVLNTIKKVFPTCRAYRDTAPYAEENFLNMVVFCTKLTTPIQWRATTNDDYLGSMARREFMPPDEGYELNLPKIIGDVTYEPWHILTKANQTVFDDYRIKSALRHWDIMRTVLPAPVWENW